jgi:AraC-like DNA-binding protein
MATLLPPRVTRYAAGLRSARHAHPYANLSVILAGSLRERVGREEVTVGPLSVVVKPAGTEHANRFGPEGATLLRVEVPTVLLEALPPMWLARVRERIRDERGRGARVHHLAADAAVHPVYLARQFRRHYGTSLTAFRHAQRVRRASTLLMAHDASLSGVAYDTGFADQPHLTRVFSRLLGVTPARYRALARGEVANVQSPAARGR